MAGLSINSSPIDNLLHSPPDKRFTLVCCVFVSPSVFRICSICHTKFVFNSCFIFVKPVYRKKFNRLTVDFFSLSETFFPNFKWAAAVMYSSTVKFFKRKSCCVTYADCLRNVLNFRLAPFTSTRPSIPPFLSYSFYMSINCTFQNVNLRDQLTLIQLKCS